VGRPIIERWREIPIENAQISYFKVLGRFAPCHDWRTNARKFGGRTCNELEAIV